MFAAAIIPPVGTISADDDSLWRLFLPTGLRFLPPLRDQFDTLVACTAEAVEAFAERFGLGPVRYPSVTVISSPATRADVPGVAVYMFSMIARVMSGDPFEGIRSVAHAHLDEAWNAAVQLDIQRALHELHTACAAIEGQSPTVHDDAVDLIVVGAHVVSMLDNLARVIDKH